MPIESMPRGLLTCGVFCLDVPLKELWLGIVARICPPGENSRGARSSPDKNGASKCSLRVVCADKRAETRVCRECRFFFLA